VPSSAQPNRRLQQQNQSRYDRFIKMPFGNPSVSSNDGHKKNSSRNQTMTINSRSNAAKQGELAIMRIKKKQKLNHIRNSYGLVPRVESIESGVQQIRTRSKMVFQSEALSREHIPSATMEIVNGQEDKLRESEDKKRTISVERT